MGGLRYELDFPLKFKKTFQRNTALWIGAALALGLCVALLRARTQKVYVGPLSKKVRSPNKSLLESGALLGLVKLAMTVVQPMVVSHFAKKGSKEGRRQEFASSRLVIEFQFTSLKRLTILRWSALRMSANFHPQCICGCRVAC